jgi:uncharacterized membrane protein
MKNKIVKWGLQYSGKKLDGKKTYAGAAGKILAGLSTMILGIVGFIGIMFPDQGLVEMPVEGAIGMVSAGFYAIASGLEGIGIGHKIEKSKETNEVQSTVVINNFEEK